MIKQRFITTKTATATLTYAEMGNVIANKETALTLTVVAASPNKGLWYYIINAGAGDCTVYEEEVGALVVLLQNESVYIVSDGTIWHVGAGGSTGEYTYSQAVPAATWTITHNMHRHPSVTVVDSAGTKVYGDITYDSQDQITITFSAAFSGTAYLN
jgi:hypothetical protein